jgi:hypothetical protein
MFFLYVWQNTINGETTEYLIPGGACFAGSGLALESDIFVIPSVVDYPPLIVVYWISLYDLTILEGFCQVEPNQQPHVRY